MCALRRNSVEACRIEYKIVFFVAYRREGRDIPIIVTSCVKEVERRGTFSLDFPAKAPALKVNPHNFFILNATTTLQSAFVRLEGSWYLPCVGAELGHL